MLMKQIAYDVAVVGGGPAGLSGAMLLARSRRRVIVCDDGQPRNAAAKTVNGFLCSDGISPFELRRRGTSECRRYGVVFCESTVVNVRYDNSTPSHAFSLELQNGLAVASRKLLLATGMKDTYPKLKGFDQFYGSSVHHCPYCDGWEHADSRLVAYGKGPAAAKLAITLLSWSNSVTCCTDGFHLDTATRQRLEEYQVTYRSEQLSRLNGNNRQLQSITFATGEPLDCDALFFSSDQAQRSPLAQMLGCECDEDRLIKVQGKQGSGVRGVFLAGDADGDVQFAIVAAAEGAIAATAINAELNEEDFP